MTMRDLRASPAIDSGRRDAAAIVLGGGITALGVTRCLARRGLPVFHVPGMQPGLLTSSRWFRPLGPPSRNGEPASRKPNPFSAISLEQVLDEAGIEESVLFPCSDQAVRAIARLPSASRERHRNGQPGLGTLEQFLDKTRLAEVLSRFDVPHPRTWPIRREADLAAIPDPVFAEALVKPADSQSFFAHFGVKAFGVHDRSEARAGLARARAARMEVVLQEWVPGPPTSHYFIDGFRASDGEIKGTLVRRRLRMYPPDFGNSTAMITVPSDQVRDAREGLARLLDATGYTGIFSAEFKRDARTGVLRLLEINVRPWWYVEFAARCGVDVCAMAYADALGGPVESAATVRTGRLCVYPYYDVHAAWRGLRGGELAVGPWARSWLGATFPVFAADDPGPALTGVGERLRGIIRRRLSGAAT